MLPSSVHQLSVGNSNPTPKIYTQTRDKRHNRLSLVCVCPDILVSVRIALSLSPVPFSVRLFPSPAATQGFSLFPLRRVQRFVVSASFPAATQVYSAFCLRRLLVPFRLCPSPSACALLLPRRKVLCRVQVFVLCFVCLLLIIAYNDCKVVLGNTMHLQICSFDRLCLARSDSAIFMHLDT